MENKINIAELLKDCPQGMELDCTMYDNCTYAGIEDVGYIDILINTPSGRIRLTKEGCYIRHDDNAKCVIFPKGKTTWEGFQRPFKDGDIVATNKGSWIGLTTGGECGRFMPTYCVIKHNGEFEAYLDRKESWNFYRLATEEEKEKLFDAIKANGYKWNAETKTLEKLPKFKVEDKIEKCGNKIPIDNQDDWKLVPNKFDINSLKPFDKVLVRDSNKGMWSASIFSHTWENKYICIGIWYNQCIPYEGNEYLLGTANDCDEYYKTWE